MFHPGSGPAVDGGLRLLPHAETLLAASCTVRERTPVRW